jgi:hypothetical protein
LLAQTDTPIKARATYEPSKETAIIGTVRLDASLADWHSFAERYEVRGHARDDLEQMFMIS